jgi:aspartyl-tRNA(Asn)/glutamyl-tRNA(Gln) amidotransferase subunit B
MKIEGKHGSYEVVIGIEIHAQLNVKAKLFSQSAVDWEDAPNTNVSMFDIAIPGKMPILNKKVVEEAVKVGLAFNATINKHSIFDRKHYFYPDLPQGYQITQFYHPIIENGNLEIELEDGSTKIIRIARAHLEQDAGKLVHDLIPNNTVVDLNRSGIPLLEIVSEADIKSPYEASEYIKNLRLTLRSIGASNGDMEKGEMRCDVNISVMPVGSKVFGTRCEIKNVNSIKFVAKAIEYEAERQVREIEAGKQIICETRLFDSSLGVTKSMRIKEMASDYRYIPEPDLKPINITEEFISSVKDKMPELPLLKRKKYKEELNLSRHEATILTEEPETAIFFESVLSEVKDAKLCANWLLVELFARLNTSGQSLLECKINPAKFAQLLLSIKSGEVSGKQAKEILIEMFETGKSANEIIKEKGFTQTNDEAEIIKIINNVLLKNAEKVLEYKSGKVKLFGFFTGEIMKASGGKVNPAITSKLLKQILES